MKTGLYLGETPIGRIIVRQVATGNAANLQSSKEITPTKTTQEIIADEEYDGLAKVIVKPIKVFLVSTFLYLAQMLKWKE